MKTTKSMLLFILLFTGICIQVNAAIFTVNNDSEFANGSLFWAIDQANASPGADYIYFSVIGTLHPFPLPITDDVTITGPGASILSISNSLYNIDVFFIDACNVTISGLSIKNDGLCGIRFLADATKTLNVSYCTFSGVGLCAIFSDSGTVNISGCTVTGNTQAAIAIYEASGIIENSTFSANHGGAIRYVASTDSNHPTSLYIINCTISGNSSLISGGGIKSELGPVTLSNTIVAGNSSPSGPDVIGGFISQGYNFIGKNDGSTGFTNGVNNDQVGTIAVPINPMLSALADNGGQTYTMALQCGSPVINAANPATTSTDQRGFGIAGGRRDIGAFEFQPLVATCSGTNVTCFGGANGIAAVTVTGGPSIVIGVGPVGAPLPYQGASPSPAISATCDCPSGYVAVGIEGILGQFVDQFKLKCKQLLPDGTLGATLVNTCSNGFGTNATAVGPFLSPTDEALVKIQILESVYGYLRGMYVASKSVSEIYSGSSNDSGLTNVGGFSYSGYSPSLVTAPDGNVITGMINYQPFANGWSLGVQFRYAPITDVPATVQYLWSNGATTSSISNLTAGTYTVTVTKGGCSTIGSFTVTEPAQLVASISGATSFCAGNSTILEAGTASSYNWSTGATTQTISVSTAGTFTVTVTNVNGCTGSISMTTTVNPNPSCTITGSGTICAGASTQWCAPAGLLYNWSNGATTQCITRSATGNYSVTTTDVKGCSSSCNKQLTVGSQLTIDAGLNKIVYKGYADSACATLTATGAGGGNPPYTLTWTGGSHATSISVCPTTSTTYYLTITDANNCSFRDSVRVCVIDVRCGSGNKKVTVCHGTGSANNPFQTICILPADAKWHFLNHPGEKLGTCGMVKTCGFPTQRWADEEMTEGVEEDISLMAYPNPASGEINIAFQSEADGKYLLRLVDITGQILLSETKDVSAGENKYTVNLQNFAPGIYTVLLQSGDNLVQTRIVKE